MDMKTFKTALKQKIAAIQQAMEENRCEPKQFRDLLDFIDQSNPHSAATKAVQVNVTNVKGILYFVDAFQNVYRTEDVLAGTDNPRIIGQAVENP
jgi:hypothetical protein